MWNPVFCHVGRKESKNWDKHNKGWRYNKESLECFFIKDDKIYDNLKNNDFNNS